ncbi:anti-sigma B factor antagonist [Carbonactinospora thermoautotrophica]|uniref:Anti-sigma factor antagonist n=1 Tax=Carbonactinospora thermoautotrophica TaxID=1469144 RepID=A0A132NCA0_9ACTN|nr:anti-sigma factor antagonist [Carbonactinospora thermoautotrophica]KWW97985.1 anti-sigma B factor antagonist [Carbonactinospora thermoautotrophica]KWX03096.1 Stage II sporulation protein [Carbonactinospora thermoautotrophica]KWX07734.1 anti-sigma B factor antagonist [Carbonactinospora thermoautotrophica]
MELSLPTRYEDGFAIIEVVGEVDVYSAPELRKCISDLVDEGYIHLILDLNGIRFFDSTGLGVLAGGLKRVRSRRGSLRLVCTSERVLRPFRITGLHKVFAIHASTEEAIRAAGRKGA